jgi:hypothetical protein
VILSELGLRDQKIELLLRRTAIAETERHRLGANCSGPADPPEPAKTSQTGQQHPLADHVLRLFT